MIGDEIFGMMKDDDEMTILVIGHWWYVNSLMVYLGGLRMTMR